MVTVLSASSGASEVFWPSLFQPQPSVVSGQDNPQILVCGVGRPCQGPRLGLVLVPAADGEWPHLPAELAGRGSAGLWLRREPLASWQRETPSGTLPALPWATPAPLTRASATVPCGFQASLSLEKVPGSSVGVSLRV